MKYWSVFVDDILKIFSDGFSRPGPLFYFFFIIVVAGGAGIWFPWVSTGEFDKNSIMTYVFALLAASIADFLIGSNKHKANKDLLIAVISLVVGVIVVTVLSVVVKDCFWVLVYRVLSLLLLWVLWWFLLDSGRFDIEQKVIENATIGSNVSMTDTSKTNLAAFRQDRKTQND